MTKVEIGIRKNKFPNLNFNLKKKNPVYNSRQTWMHKNTNKLTTTE